VTGTGPNGRVIAQDVKGFKAPIADKKAPVAEIKA